MVFPFYVQTNTENAQRKSIAVFRFKCKLIPKNQQRKLTSVFRFSLYVQINATKRKTRTSFRFLWCRQFIPNNEKRKAASVYSFSVLYTGINFWSVVFPFMYGFRARSSLRASSPFGGVARSHARAARERRQECEVRRKHSTLHNTWPMTGFLVSR